MPTKSPLRWHGGKSYLAKKIIDLLPPRGRWHLWREPYFGGGSVTMQLDPEGVSEAVNDVDDVLIKFWDVLQTPKLFEKFQWMVTTTPFHEDYFRASISVLGMTENDPVKTAWAFFVNCRQSRQGLMKDFATPTRRLRRGMNENVSAWLSAIEGLTEVHERLKRIEIRNMDACDFIRKYDDPRAVFYCDPPYLHETRSTGGGEYRHEMTEEQHAELLTTLSEIKGRFLLSGYPSTLYQYVANIEGWNRVDIKIDNKASSKKTKEIKTECVWMNY